MDAYSFCVLENGSFFPPGVNTNFLEPTRFVGMGSHQPPGLGILTQIAQSWPRCSALLNFFPAPRFLPKFLHGSGKGWARSCSQGGYILTGPMWHRKGLIPWPVLSS